MPLVSFPFPFLFFPASRAEDSCCGGVNDLLTISATETSFGRAEEEVGVWGDLDDEGFFFFAAGGAVGRVEEEVDGESV